MWSSLLHKDETSTTSKPTSDRYTDLYVKISRYVTSSIIGIPDIGNVQPDSVNRVTENTRSRDYVIRSRAHPCVYLSISWVVCAERPYVEGNLEHNVPVSQ